MVIYSKTILNVSNESTLIIIDWDDTLFPTSWNVKNNIDLLNPKINDLKYFNILDKQLSSLLEKILLCGEIIIITNATLSWVYTTLTVLPKTKYIMDNITVISARDKYQNITIMNDWKKYTFLDEVNKRCQYKHYNNIISIGDADYEYNALINLYNTCEIKYKYLKTVRFLKTIDKKTFIDQLVLLQTNILYISNMKRHNDIIIKVD
jgi:hypothetical protein